MATNRSRIGLVKDPALEAAMQATRDLLDPKQTRSQAGHVRHLALIGARSLMQGNEELQGMATVHQRLLEIPGIRPATRRLEDLPWLGKGPIDRTSSASKALDWVRGDR